MHFMGAFSNCQPLFAPRHHRIGYRDSARAGFPGIDRNIDFEHPELVLCTARVVSERGTHRAN